MFDIWHVMNKCTVVAKRELFYCWPFGLAAWLAGLIFIDRVKGEKARDILNEVNSKVKKQKIKLWVFPEGTRRNTGELHPFKKGAFHMAIDEQIPILPVVFSSYCTFLNDKKKILNAGNIIITTLPPISTEGLTKDDMPELMEKVHKVMSEALKQSSNEVLQRYASNSLKSKSNLLDNSVTSAAATTINPIQDSTPKIRKQSSNNSITPITPASTTPTSLQPCDPTLTSQAQDIVNNTNINTSDFKDPITTTKTQALVH